MPAILTPFPLALIPRIPEPPSRVFSCANGISAISRSRRWVGFLDCQVAVEGADAVGEASQPCTPFLYVAALAVVSYLYVFVAFLSTFSDPFLSLFLLLLYVLYFLLFYLVIFFLYFAF